MRLDTATIIRTTGAEVVRAGADGEAVHGFLSVADLQNTFSEVTIDSRSASPDSLFVALEGERVDGHDFIPAAISAGIGGCLVSRIPDVTLGRDRRIVFFVVPDPLVALQDLAHGWRMESQAEVIGITGSIGKTTTKEIVASTLAARWPVLKSMANLNTEIGLPLNLLRLRPDHRAAVLEMGMYARGDIALLTRIARPRIGIVTNVAPIHLERMGTIQHIARAKSELVAGLPRHGIAVLNGDDSWTRAMRTVSGSAPGILVGYADDCDYRASQVQQDGLNGISFVLRAEGRHMVVETQVPGSHTVHAFLAAAAVARAMQLDWDEILAALSQVRLDERQRVIQGPGSLLIIDDSYNAAPPSMDAALQLLAAAPGRKIAVLGDMLELGPEEEEAHRQVGSLAAGVADWLIARGSRGGWMAEEAEKNGLSPEHVFRAETNEEAVQAVRRIMAASARTGSAAGVRTMQDARPDQTVQWSVLVKGSRGMRMEEVVQGLRGEL